MQTVVNKTKAPKFRLDNAAPNILLNKNNSGSQKRMDKTERKTAKKTPQFEYTKVAEKIKINLFIK
jgi:hypothetical protein